MKLAALLGFVLLAGCTKKGPSEWDKTDVMIPARDGVKLHTLIFAPKNASGRLPFLIERSPYGFDNGRAERTLATRYKELADEGFIFVLQDIRGRYQSEGQFVMQRPVHDRSQPNSIDEGTDTYDTIDWLLKNVPNHNGRAGLLGISYGGWLTAMALIEPHPALKAASEQASPADMYLGDDFHHNGAFRLSYGFEYVARMETGKVQYKFDFDKYDTFDWYLTLGPLSEIDKRYFHGEKPTWNNFVNHPNYDSFWQQQAVQRILTKTSVPNLNVAGWWDQEDYWGPMKIYETLEKDDADHKNYLVIGPWRHGGWGGDGKNLGPIDFSGDQSKYFREKIEAPWFAYWLKDKGQLHQPEAMAFETGRNTWEKYDAWPPAEGNPEAKALYFRVGRIDLRCATRQFRQCIRQLRFRPCASRALSPSSDSADLFVQLRLDAVAGGGSALRRPAPRCSELEDRALAGRPSHRRRRGRALVRVDHGIRRRLDREAHRRLSGERRKAARL